MNIKGQIGCKIDIKGQEASVLFITGLDRMQAMREDPGGTAAQISLKKEKAQYKIALSQDFDNGCSNNG